MGRNNEKPFWEEVESGPSLRSWRYFDGTFVFANHQNDAAAENKNTNTIRSIAHDKYINIEFYAAWKWVLNGVSEIQQKVILRPFFKTCSSTYFDIIDNTHISEDTLNFITAVRPLAWHPGQWHGLRVAQKKNSITFGAEKKAVSNTSISLTGRILLWIHSPSSLTSFHRIADWRGTLGGGVGRQSLHQRNVPDVEGCERPRQRRQRVAVGAKKMYRFIKIMILPPIVSCRQVDEFKKGGQPPKRPLSQQSGVGGRRGGDELFGKK